MEHWWVDEKELGCQTTRYSQIPNFVLLENYCIYELHAIAMSHTSNKASKRMPKLWLTNLSCKLVHNVVVLVGNHLLTKHIHKLSRHFH